ncbi:MAG: efflux RND transporter periplasmic adaptor subunit [Lachnospiraceae bacterium]|nr:efflux RND transporter periplasmic adaptor subunit [Lachnospiraceae bacterium]
MNYKNITLAVALAATLAFTGCSAKETTGEQVINEISVEVATAQTGAVETNYVYSGKTAPVETAEVFSTIGGKVKKVNFDIGDSVKAGDILFEMDTEAYETTLKSQQASYTAAMASVSAAQTTLDTVNGATMQIQIENARVAMENAKLVMDTAKIDYDNKAVLFEQGYISQTDIDDAKDKFTKAETAYNQAQHTYELTKGQMIEENTKKAQDSLNAAQASANATATQMETTKKSIRDAKVKSPISGVITANNVTAETVLSTVTVPFVVADTSKMVVDVSVSEQIINSLSNGQHVNVKIAAADSDKLTGTIKTINPAASAKGTYDVEIEIENASGAIKSGMFSEVSFSKEKGYNSVVLDRNAVVSKNNEDYVFIEKDGIAVKTNVVMGIDDGKTVQILDGINVGDKVIVKGQSYLKDGDVIKVVAIDGNTVESANTDDANKVDSTKTNDGKTVGSAEKKGE